MDRYEEALERARKGKPIDEVFPELKESEDERIRKEIIRYLKSKVATAGEEELLYFKRWIAYLEKQKETLKSVNSIPSNCVSDVKNENEHNESGDFVFELRQIISRHWYADEFSYRVDDEEGMASEIMSLCEKQKEQEPVKLNDDTEVGLNRALRIVKHAKGNLCGYQSDDGIYECCHAIQTLENILKDGIEQKSAECIEDSVKFKEGFKAGRESGLCDGQKYVLDNLDSYGLCKPAEWSEEDEKMMERLIRHTQKEFDELCNDRYGHQEIISDLKESCRERMNWLENRLKSLRPQPHWKPSEVQMDALAWYSGNSGVPPTGDKAIKSLYDDLKKL